MNRLVVGEGRSWIEYDLADPTEIIIDRYHHANDHGGEGKVQLSFEGDGHEQKLGDKTGERGDSGQRSNSADKHESHPWMLLGQVFVVTEFMLRLVLQISQAHNAENTKGSKKVNEHVEEEHPNGIIVVPVESIRHGSHDGNKQVPGVGDA